MAIWTLYMGLSIQLFGIGGGGGKLVPTIFQRYEDKVPFIYTYDYKMGRNDIPTLNKIVSFDDF